MSATEWMFLLTLVGAPVAGGLLALAHGLGWLVARAEEHRRMPVPFTHELDD